MIAAEGVTLSRGARTVLAGLDFTLRPGELVALLGPNGAGKSTLIQALTGELQPTAGRILLDGRPLGGYPPAELARRRAVLPQQSRLAFGFTVLEVVSLGRSAHAGLTSMLEDRAAITAGLDAAGVRDFAGRDYRQLSGGEQQRVQLARCLAQIWRGGADGEGRYLLLDEPVASLDLAYQQSVLRAARRQADGGCGVLASLHDPNLAAAHADRILLLGEGRLLADGPPAAVLRPELLERVYGLPLIALTHPVSGATVLLPG